MRLAGAPTEAVSTRQIADAFANPQHHPAKVERPASEIAVAQVVRHPERRFAIVECPRADRRTRRLT